MTADYLFIHAILITMRGNGVGILEDGAVAVTGNRISAVGATKEVLQDWSAHRVIDASGKVASSMRISIREMAWFAVCLRI